MLLISRFMPGIEAYSLPMGPSLWLTPVEKLLEAVACRNGLVSGAGIPNNIGPSVGMWEDMYQVPVGFEQPSVLVIYGLVGVVLTAFGGWIYYKRRAETAGEMTAFSAVRTICKIIAALMVSAGGVSITLNSGMFQGRIPFRAALLCVLIFGALGWFVAEMVVEKTLRVFRKKSIRSCGILLLALVAVLAVGWLDLLGIVRHTPKPEEVDSVTVCYDYGGSITVKPEDAIALHKTVLQQRDALTNNYRVQYGEPLELNYTLKDGRKFQRTYEVRNQDAVHHSQLDNPICQEVYKLFQKPEYNFQTYFWMPEEAFDVNSITDGYIEMRECYIKIAPDADFALNTSAEDTVHLELMTPHAKKLYAAINADIAEEKIMPNGYSSTEDANCVGRIQLNFHGPQYDSVPDDGEMAPLPFTEIPLLTDMTHTMDCLEEMGIELYLDEPYGGG